MQDFLLIHLIPVDFTLPLLESFKVILRPGLSQAHRGTLVGPMLSRDKCSCYVLSGHLSYQQDSLPALPKSVSCVYDPPDGSPKEVEEELASTG